MSVVRALRLLVAGLTLAAGAFSPCAASLVDGADGADGGTPHALRAAPAAISPAPGVPATGPAQAPALRLAQTSSPAGQSANPLSALQELSQGLLGTQEQDFLDPEDAFVLSASADDQGRVELRWDIAEGYYLYRKRFGVEPAAAAASVSGAAASPAGAAFSVGALEIAPGEIKHDEYFGDVEVYYTEAVLRAPLSDPDGGAAAGPRTVELDVRYQGCADAGLCYPPITKTVSVDLPPAALLAASDRGGGAAPAMRGEALASPAGGGVTQAELPEQDRIAAALAGGSAALALLTFFGFGLLLTFTPCVLPMIPILSGIIVGQGDSVSTGRAFRLSLTYVLAMAAAYTALGVAVGLSGGGLQAVFQEPWVLVTFSAVFVLLALSMFGFYDLQVPAVVQERLARLSNGQRGGTYAGVAIMGLLSALIVGPCIAPPLAGALIYIGRTGDALLGGAALFALSMGMGVPLLVAGTSAGRFLPRTGPWMNAVKAVFGVLLLAVAVYLLERVVPAWAAMLLWAALLIVTAIYLGALEGIPAGASGWRRLWKGAGLVMLVYGVLLMVGAGSGGSLLRPLQGLAQAGAGGQAPAHGLVFRRVEGLAGFEAALREASARGRPVMLDFYADWCVSCKEMEAFTFTDVRVQAALEGVTLLQADVTANNAGDQALLRRFDLFGPPAILFFGADGVERPQYRVVGFMRADEFRSVAARAVAPPATTRLSAARGAPGDG